MPALRRPWFWVLATVLLLVAAGLVAFRLALSQEGGYLLTLSRFDGQPNGPVHNLTDAEAAQLPGHLPQVLGQAREAGSARASFASQAELERFQEGTQHSRFLRYGGTLFRVDSLIASG